MEAALLVAAALLLVLGGGAEALSLDLYEERCPEAEAAVTAAVRQAMAKDRTVAAGLLRMHFHDCFVRVRMALRCHCILISILNK
jgi:peroxidase